MEQFDQIYSAIAQPANYIAPDNTARRMDNWAADRYQKDNWFAGMADGGYSRWVGQLDENGAAVWRVNWGYNRPLTYTDISVDDFARLVVQSLHTLNKRSEQMSTFRNAATAMEQCVTEMSNAYDFASLNLTQDETKGLRLMISLMNEFVNQYDRLAAHESIDFDSQL